MKKNFSALLVGALIIMFATGCSKHKNDLFSVSMPALENQNYSSDGIPCGLYEDTGKTNAALELLSVSRVTTSNDPFVVFIDVDGAAVNSPAWNGGNAFVVDPSGLNSQQLDSAIAMVRVDYGLFKKIRFTLDESDYTAAFNANPQNAARVIVGRTMILGPYPGYAYLNSSLWGDGTPSFVLVNNCNPEGLVQDIGNGISHELGHMLGRPHQHGTSQDGNYLEYHPGWGQIGTFWCGAYIMGQFNRTFTVWGTDDVTALAERLELKADDYSNNLNNYYYVSNVERPFKGFLGSGDAGDIGGILPDLALAKPFVLRSGGNCPVRARFYNSVTKQIISSLTIATTNSMTATVMIPPGKDLILARIDRFVDNPNGFTSTLGTTTWSTNWTRR